MKKIIAVLLTVMLLFAFVACSAGNSESTEETTVAETTQQDEQSAPDGKMNFENMTIGKITKISGNQVTLELGTIDTESMSMPEGMSKPDGTAPDGTMPEGMSAPDDFDPEDMPEDMSKPDGTMPEGMSVPDDFDPENMPEDMSKPDGFGGKDSSGGGMPGFNVEVEYTGETAKYTIPSEVQVGNGDYTSLSEGMVIGLGFDEDGVVDSVMIISQKGN